MAAQDKKLHIVMFPWLAFGHIIPHLELSKAIAQKGHKVSFISTPRNIDRLPKLPPHLSSNITLVKIPLPKVSGLPEDAEATKDISYAHVSYLKKAYDGLEPGLTRFLEESDPDWIIHDFAPHWMPRIASRLGISRGFFCITEAWFVAFLGPLDGLISGSRGSKPENFMVPPEWVKFETKVAFRRFEAKWMVQAPDQKNDDFQITDYYRVGKVIEGCEAIFLRSCYEFEPRWLTVVEELYNKPVIPVGFLPPKMVDNTTDENDESWLSIKNWLDSQTKGSVVYVALGSEVTPSQDQLSELAYGLELSGVPFFFVLHKSLGSTRSSSVELPVGFEQRTSGQGLVLRSWAPQVKILSHGSIGGFLTHCGWTSIVEALMFGHPLIGLPFIVDQGLNCRVVVENQFGFEIPRNEDDGSYTRNSIAESVRLVMLEDEGKKFKEKAKEMSAIFANTKLHDQYFDNFVKFLENHKSV